MGVLALVFSFFTETISVVVAAASYACWVVCFYTQLQCIKHPKLVHQLIKVRKTKSLTEDHEMESNLVESESDGEEDGKDMASEHDHKAGDRLVHHQDEVNVVPY